MTTATITADAPLGAHTAQETIFDMDRDYVMGTYARQPVVIERGEGARVWDNTGKEYLDFLSGIAVVGIGHCHPRVANAIAEQAHKLMHISNLFHNTLQAKLAQRLCELSGMDTVFFCNSGTEAIEAALKIARKWGKLRRGEDCFEIVTFEGSFHGRTMGAVTATAQPKYQKPFLPLVPGFRYVPLNDLTALTEVVGKHTCAVMIEPIQGESGIQMASPEFLFGLQALCKSADVLLILDEIQCGMGRTGSFLASQSVGITGDIVTMAKGIADGFPMGACLARGTAATTLVPGDHGSTFAGQPLACAASLATLDVLIDEKLMQNAAEVGSYFIELLCKLKTRTHGGITEVRGTGLMIGIQLAEPKAKAVQASLMRAGIIINAVGDSILRLLPPLCVTKDDCDIVAGALDSAINS